VNWEVDAAWFAEARRWMADSYLTLRRPFHVHNVYRYPSWLAEYAGEHPPEVLRMLRDVRGARAGEALAEEQRGTRDVRRLLRSPWYAAARAAVEAAEPLGRRAGEQARRVGRAGRRAAAAFRPALDAAGAAARAPGAEEAGEIGRRGARRVRRSAGRRSAAARERISPGALILAYHRVAAPADDPQAMCVSPERFAGHLEAIKAFGVCVSVRDLVRRMAVAAVPRRTVVLTFDDGYADNLHVAEPLLWAAGAPATMFVSAGLLDDGAPFWWDELADLVLGGADGQAGGGAGGGADRWDLRREDDPTPAHAEYRRLAGELRRLSPAGRDRVLAPLRASRGGRGEGPPLLSADEVRRLSSSPVVEIGSHALTHTLFTVLDEAQIRAELVESRRRLQELTGRGCDLLSYPFGGDGDLPPGAPPAAHDCGYMAACANVPGTVWRRSDPYTLPRLLVRDWEPEELAERLERWASGDVEGLW
jgi:peptidoglycan/xylan/chitin deacetylase (PgdA/CDA1 family)